MKAKGKCFGCQEIFIGQNSTKKHIESCPVLYQYLSFLSEVEDAVTFREREADILSQLLPLSQTSSDRSDSSAKPLTTKADGIQISNTKSPKVAKGSMPSLKKHGYLLKIVDQKKPTVYFLYIAIPSSFTLFHLDQFLRMIWCECCSGHISRFSGESPTSLYRQVESKPSTDIITFDKSIELGYLFLLREHRNHLIYEYDMNQENSTVLEISCNAVELTSCPQSYITILMRNEEIEYVCDRCYVNRKNYGNP
jgi:hypothetical protein